jgi:hypothetical protein
LVHCSGKVDAEIRGLLRLALVQGRGAAAVKAFRQIIDRLENDPLRFGEPTFRLSALRLRLRTGIVKPLVVDYAVSEDHRMVWIKVVKLLSDPSR